MSTKLESASKQDFQEEVSEWIEAFDEVIASDWEQGAELLGALKQRAREAGVPTPSGLIRPYQNTIPKHDEVPYPGDRALEKRVEALLRWNAMAMVVEQTLANEKGVFVAASDYMKAMPEMIARWVPGGLTPLGTDGFGRSESREALRRHFEIDAEHVAFATISTLARDGKLDKKTVQKAVKLLNIDPEQIDPVGA